MLDAYVFESLDQVREISAEWMQEHKEERPHDTLDGMPPTSFRVRMTAGSSPLILSPWRGRLSIEAHRVPSKTVPVLPYAIATSTGEALQ